LYRFSVVTVTDSDLEYNKPEQGVKLTKISTDIRL
jgi:hypothetical protein